MYFYWAIIQCIHIIDTILTIGPWKTANTQYLGACMPFTFARNFIRMAT